MCILVRACICVSARALISFCAYKITEFKLKTKHFPIVDNTVSIDNEISNE